MSMKKREYDKDRSIEFLEKLQLLCEEYDVQIYNRNELDDSVGRLYSTLHIRIGSTIVEMPKRWSISSLNLTAPITDLKFDNI